MDITPTPGSAPDKAILTAKVTEKATGELTFGGGYSTDVGPLLDIGLGETNLVGSGISANINGILAMKRSSIDLSLTDPYFLDRNLVAGADVFLIQTDYLGTEPYDERREGFALRLGYDFNDHLSQVWSYSLVATRRVQHLQHGERVHRRPGWHHVAVAGQPGADAGLSRQQGRSAYRLSVVEAGHRLRRPWRRRGLYPRPA